MVRVLILRPSEAVESVPLMKPGFSNPAFSSSCCICGPGQLHSVFNLNPTRNAAVPARPANTDLNELAAWTTVARALLNLDEAITKE